MTVGDLGFFLREALAGLKIHRVANFISIICIGLALLSLGLVAGTWANLQHVADTLRQDAEIVVYLDDDVSLQEAEQLSRRLLDHQGVSRTRVVCPDETLLRVESLIGSDIDILSVLEGHNPFAASIEVGVDAGVAAEVVSFSGNLAGVDYIRDNEEVLAPLLRLTSLIQWAGLVVILAVALVTTALVAHIVRLGMSARQQEMETLRLLGASEGFVCAPFVFEGALLGAAGALFAAFGVAAAGGRVYQLIRTGLPYLPLAAGTPLLGYLALLVLGVGLTAGTLGSLVALRSA